MEKEKHTDTTYGKNIRNQFKNEIIRSKRLDFKYITRTIRI